MVNKFNLSLAVLISLCAPVNAQNLPNSTSISESRPEPDFGRKSQQSSSSIAAENTKSKVSRIMGETSGSGRSSGDGAIAGSSAQNVKTRTSQRVTEILSPENRSKSFEAPSNSKAQEMLSSNKSRIAEVLGKNHNRSNTETASSESGRSSGSNNSSRVVRRGGKSTRGR